MSCSCSWLCSLRVALRPGWSAIIHFVWAPRSHSQKQFLASDAPIQSIFFVPEVTQLSIPYTKILSRQLRKGILGGQVKKVFPSSLVLCPPTTFSAAASPTWSCTAPCRSRWSRATPTRTAAASAAAASRRRSSSDSTAPSTTAKGKTWTNQSLIRYQISNIIFAILAHLCCVASHQLSRNHFGFDWFIRFVLYLLGNFALSLPHH